ncbi:MAG TPA: DinB family protein [Terriglobia bacterium]|nr:DinB family protein [Terriglobia bacterium]
MAAKMKPFVLVDALLEMYAANNRITRYLIENLPEEAWQAEPPDGKGRTVAAIAAHIHNVRGMWLKAAGGELVDKIEPRTATRAEVLAALDRSHTALNKLLKAALAGDGRVKGFRPDAAGFIGYLVSHDAHHRGQMTMLARQAGHPLPQKAMFGMWEWGQR